MAVDDGARTTLSTDDDFEIGHAADTGYARGRSPGIYTLTVINLLLAGLAVLALRTVAGAETYTLKESADIGADLEATLLGLSIMRFGLYTAVAGFALAALATLSLMRLGWRVQIFWAALVGLTLVGLPYSVPVIVFMLNRRTRSRFFGPPLDS